jgi:hypothetical protein
LNSKNKLDLLYQKINKEFKVLAGISLGVFLFILFFQPFQLSKLNFDNQLLFTAGLGVIMFLFLSLVRIGIPWMVQKHLKNNQGNIVTQKFSGFLMFVLNALAFAFYLRYVGFVEITFYVMFKVVFICLIPPLILHYYDRNEEFMQSREMLAEKNRELQNQIDHLLEGNLKKTLTLYSENQSEGLNFSVADIVMIRSADNYVEIIHKVNNSFKRQLLRNTLKNIEHQAAHFDDLIRCHRTCIININYVSKLKRKQNSYWLSIQNFSEEVPVSRQYLLRVREAFSAQRGE